MSKINTMKIDGHYAVISCDADLDMFRGEFVGLNGSAAFYATTVEKLKTEGRKSLREFLSVCKERGITPEKDFSGTFNLRVGKKRREELAIAAAVRGVSMNKLIDQAIEHELSC